MKLQIGTTVTVTTGQHRGERGQVAGKTGAGWLVKLAGGKTVTLSAASLRKAGGQ